MSLTLEFNLTPHYLVAKIIGLWTTTEIFKSIEDIKIEADNAEIKNILCDLTGLSVPVDELSRYYSGEKIASTFGYSYKIAGFSQSEKINKLAENVSVNRGANFRMFDSETDAINWLLN